MMDSDNNSPISERNMPLQMNDFEHRLFEDDTIQPYDEYPRKRTLKQLRPHMLTSGSNERSRDETISDIPSQYPAFTIGGGDSINVSTI